MTSVSYPTRSFVGRVAAWFSRRRALLLPGMLALAGILLVLSNTRWGAYLSDDSYYYIYPAREFAAGQGFNPSYIFAPMLPFVLSLISLAGVDALASIRWLNALLFGINLLLVAALVGSISRRPAFAILGAALVLLADVVVEAHGWAMSEALSFTFMLASLLAAHQLIVRQQQRYVWLAAAAAALCVLTRYAALPIIATVALTLLFFYPAPGFLRRLGLAAAFGAASLAPIATYWLRNQLSSGQPVRYQQFLNVPFDRAQLAWFCYHWFSLFVPGRLLREREILAAGLISLAAILVLAGLAWRYRAAIPAPGTAAFRTTAGGVFLLAAFLALNLIMLYLARGLTELDVFNPRYLVPMLTVFLALWAVLAGLLWPLAGRWMKLAIVTFFAVFLVYYGYRTFEFSRQMARTGLGYANVGWHESETVAFLQQNPQLTRLVSTGELGIYFWTGRMPRGIVEFPAPGQLRDYLCQEDAALLVMNQMPADLYGMSHESVTRDLRLVRQFNDSEMYGCPTATQ